MRWGAASETTESPRWVRPLQGIVALLGDKLVPVQVAGVESGAATVGHRFHHPGKITIGSAADYVEKLRACHVIVDGAERRGIIAVGAKLAAQKAGLSLVEDEGLLFENAGLTEWPVPLLGRFDEAFLDVPPEVIQLTARVNQKYFVCRDADGKLANAFVCVANIDAADGGAKIVEGNQKVLAARLSDARFFYETDLKTRLEDLTPKLEKIVFHEKLGTVADKVDRVAKLARWLVEEGIIPLPLGEEGARSAQPSGKVRAGEGTGVDPQPSALPPSPDGRGKLAALAERAARLAKADLLTGMVGEFPELQGLMGGYYAAAQGEPAEVAEAIRDHYKPVGQGDNVPTAPVTVAVSLADKLDTLVSFFTVDLRPSGSRDPFALRRAAIAIVSTILGTGIRLPLRTVLARHQLDLIARLATLDQREKAAQLFEKFGDLTSSSRAIEVGIEILRDELFWTNPKAEAEATAQVRSFFALLDFFADRLKVQQREAGVRHDLIDAVFALGGEDDLVRLLARVKALQAFVETKEGANLLAGYKRAANILKKEEWSGEGGTKKELSYNPQVEEQSLIHALDSAEPIAAAAIEREDFEGAMAALASLRAPIDAFFDKVTVNDSDQDKRAARLALLARMRDAVHKVADFSKIEG